MKEINKERGKETESQRDKNLFFTLKWNWKNEKGNKTGLQPVSRPVEWVHYIGGGVEVQSPFDVIAVQNVTLFAMHVCKENLPTRSFFAF